MQIRASVAAGGSRRHHSAFPFSFLILAAIGCCLALAACGGSGSENVGGEASSQKNIEQRMVKFTKCLREHGVQAETSAGNGPKGRGFGVKIAGGPPAGGPAGGQKEGGGPPPQVERAMNACKQYRPQPKQLDLSPAEKAEQAKKALEFARCMRSHGIQVPDPGPDGTLELNDVNPQSATFEAAQNACQHLMGKAPLAIRARIGGSGGHGGVVDQSFRSEAPAGGGEK